LKIIILTIFFLTNIFCLNVLAQSIAVVNIQFLIDNNTQYVEKTKELEISQEKFLFNFNKKENELKNMLDDIESSKLILNKDEINSKIERYNSELNEFSTFVDEFNYHYDSQIIAMREVLLKKIIILLENYAMNNNIDLILDSANYLIASNSINITDYIKDKLNEININLEYEEFERN